MDNPFIGMIIMVGFNFAPRGWAFCNGALLPIASYTALFSLLGTTYGGDGRTTFALPDLRGRVPLHPGVGPGLSPRTLGDRGGAETHTLLTSEMPAHSHVATGTQNVFNGAGDSSNPTGLVPAQLVRETAYSSSPANAQFATDSVNVAVQDAGGNLAHNNMQPYTAVNFVIALEGIFPSRN